MRAPPFCGTDNNGGISEGAWVVNRLVGRVVGRWRRRRHLVGVSSWRAGAPAKTVGSRWSARSRRRGRTTLTPPSGGAHWIVDDSKSMLLLTGAGPVFASGSSRVGRWLRCGRLGCRGISSFRGWAHDAIVATTTAGLNQFDDSADGSGVMPW